VEQPDKNRPDNPFEAVSYDLNKFRERRIADRRFMPRGSADRRVAKPGPATQEPAQGAGDPDMNPP
jgi:hypothetical protein